MSGVDYESLERRLALTTFIVNSTVDDTDGSFPGISLREAIVAANTNGAFGQAPAGSVTGDVIRFSSGLTGATLTLTGGEFSISDDVTIQGSGVTIDADSNSRIFQITTNERVRLSRMTLTGGVAGAGGAIHSSGGGKTVVARMTFDSNNATGPGGGAIFHNIGDLHIKDSVFSGNRASGGSGRGGAILMASGKMAMVNGTLESNSAIRAGGAFEVVVGQAILNDVTVGSAGKGNVAGLAGNANPGNGGGLHVSGAATVVVNGGRFEANRAAREGGGLWNHADAVMYIREGALITGNTASGSALHDGGGGVFNNGGRLIVKSSTIDANVASGNFGRGGGVYSVAGKVLTFGATISGNSAARAGGGVELVSGFLLLNNSTVIGNDAGLTVSSAAGDGGGVHVAGAATVLMTAASIEGNRAARQGGGVWNHGLASIYIRNATMFEGNVASGDAADGGGGGLFNAGGAVVISDSTFAMNQATGFQGSGGGIFSTDGSVLVFNSTFDGNAAARAGGGVEIVDGLIRMVGVTVSNNDAGVTVAAAVPGHGGAVHAAGSATVFVEGGEFKGNRAANQGGAFWNSVDASLHLRTEARLNNNATTSLNGLGGGVYSQGYFSALDSFFGANSSTSLGGGVCVAASGRARIENSRLQSNSASTRGGGIYNYGFMFVKDSNFTSNAAGFSGGAYGTHAGATTKSVGNTFSGNVPNNF